MADPRRNRGPHPEDRRWFSAEHWPALAQGTYDLSWLLTRGYSMTGSLKLVGDRYCLRQRQRIAVMRSACSDQALAERQTKRVDLSRLPQCLLHLDGFNVLTTLEAAMAGGVLLRGRDGCVRDMASMHGTYRRVEQTEPAVQMVGRFLAQHQVRACLWLLDQPVSNSGRLAQRIRKIGQQNGWDWQVELALDPDAVLKRSAEIVASADSVILDSCRHWFDLASSIITDQLPDQTVVPMTAAEPQAPQH